MDTTANQQANEGILSCKPELPRVSPWEKERLRAKIPLENAIMAIKTQYEPLPSDIILASYPKTGTTWLKALTSTIIIYSNSNQSSDSQVIDPLLTHNPHQLIPFLEEECIGEQPIFDIRKMTSSPRVFSTHIRYPLLPENIKNSGCKMVYITRNPMDSFISMHLFFNKRGSDVPIEEALADYCRGVVAWGPYFDHVVEYWRACKERPGTLLFLTYEELKQNPYKNLRRLADFLGCSLDPQEIEQVVEKCSFDRLSNLDVNKDTSNLHWAGWDFSSFFRRGIVNDWRNYLTPDMVEQLKELATQKWEGAEDLKFQLVDEILGSSYG